MLGKLYKKTLLWFSKKKDKANDAEMSEPMMINVPQRWVHLSMEQLLKLHGIVRKDDDTDGGGILYKMAQFLVLVGCDVESSGYGIDGKALPTYINGVLVERTNEAVSKAMDVLTECMRGEHGMITLKRVTGKSSESGSSVELWNVGKDEFMGAVVEGTKWLEEKEEMMRLVKLPDSHIKIDGITFALPEFMMQNITYRQYTVAQQFIEAFWKLSPLTPEGGSLAESTLKKLETYQRNVMAALMVPTHIEQRMVEVEDEKGIRSNKRHEVRVAEDYTSEGHERVKEVMRSAPEGLFLVLLQYVQSCNNTFKSWYPQLFREVSDDKGEVKGNVIVAEQGTVLMLVQEGYFPNVEAVMNANVGYVLKALNTMNEKAEMTRDAMRKHK